MLHAVHSTTFILVLGAQLVEPSGTKILAFQQDSGGHYSIKEWAEFKGTIPHLNEFTFCWWEKLMFVSVRDSCQWAFCYKNTNDHAADHHCTQFWYNRDAGSGGRYVRAAGGFGDNSYGGNLAYHTTQPLTSYMQKYWWRTSSTGHGTTSAGHSIAAPAPARCSSMVNCRDLSQLILSL